MCEETNGYEEELYDDYDCECDENKQLSLDIMEILIDTEAVNLKSKTNAKNVEEFMTHFVTIYKKLEECDCGCYDAEDCDCDCHK